MKALVTGASGFIGQALTGRLLEAGHSVVAVSRRPPRLPLRGARYVQADVSKPESLGVLAGAYDQVFHLAATVSFSPDAKAELMAVNAVAAGEFAKLAASWGCGSFVLASSACVAGVSDSPSPLLNESSKPPEEQIARNPYMESKIAAEAAVLAVERGAMKLSIVNPTTVYGPGDFTLNSGRIFERIAKGGVIPVPPGGSNAVDVSDVAEGMLLAASAGRDGERYILGGANLRFAEIFKAVAEACGSKAFFVKLPFAMRLPLALAVSAVAAIKRDRLLTPQIVEDLFRFKFYDCSKAKAELGWTPSHDFASSASRAWEFYKKEGVL